MEWVAKFCHGWSSVYSGGGRWVERAASSHLVISFFFHFPIDLPFPIGDKMGDAAACERVMQNLNNMTAFEKRFQVSLDDLLYAQCIHL